jgi:hypothetical protein
MIDHREHAIRIRAPLDPTVGEVGLARRDG